MEQSRTESSLSDSVLVLNRFYMAVHVVSVRRALVMLYRELADVIHVEDGQYSNYDFESWLEISEFTLADQAERDSNHEWIRSVTSIFGWVLGCFKAKRLVDVAIDIG